MVKCTVIGNGGDGMPIYPVKNYKTGETKELNLTIANYEKWREVINNQLSSDVKLYISLP